MQCCFMQSCGEILGVKLVERARVFPMYLVFNIVGTLLYIPVLVYVYKLCHPCRIFPWEIVGETHFFL